MERICRQTYKIHRYHITYMHMRRKNIISTAAFVMFLLVRTAAGYVEVSAQEGYQAVPVSVSQDKVRVGGKICYSHIVREKQTLYSISKAYGVSQEDILRYNPKLEKEALKKNDILIIPSQEALQADMEKVAGKKNGNDNPAEEKRTEENVEKKTEERVVEKTEEKVEEKTVGKEQRQARLDSLTQKSVQKEPVIHIRKWTEDLDAIAEKYGVSVEALMKANNLKSRKLKRKQRLIIPALEEEKVEKKQEDEQEMLPPSDTTSADKTVPDEVKEKPKRYLFPKSKVNATLLLPLTLPSDGRASRNNMDFYSGVLLAVRDLAEEGISTNLAVHDITTGAVPKEQISDADIIIGPVSANDLSRFMQEAQPSDVISPLDPRAEKLIYTYGNFVQAPTPARLQYEDLAKWVKEDMTPKDTLLIISEKGSRNDIAAIMKASLDSLRTPFLSFEYSILEGRDVMDPLKSLTTDEGTNRVLVASDSEAFVNDVIRNLNLLIYNNIDVVIYAPAKVRTFETIEVDHFHKSSMHLSLGYYVDYESAMVKDFLMKYRALFNTEPGSYAFQGYDIARYFITLCQKYGDDWMDFLEENDKEMIQSSFRFRKEGNGGYVNTGLRRIVYNAGYSISEVQ